VRLSTWKANSLARRKDPVMVAQLLLGVRGLSYSSLMRRLYQAPRDAEEPRGSERQHVPARPATAAAPALGGARAQRGHEPSPWAS
jgi:hypothetical protein